MKHFLFYLLITITILSCKKDPITGGFNSAPVANAGADQTITLPANTATLDGSGSTDPENNIIRYDWTKISGASLFTTSNAKQLKVNLGLGANRFELKVTDAGGLTSKDTIKVTLNTWMPSLSPCLDSPRPEVNAELVPIGALSQTRQSVASVSLNTKIFFAGGDLYSPPYNATSRVDIYDVNTHAWSLAELSVPRSQIATVATGNKVFFAGGVYYINEDKMRLVGRVDIYDVTTNTWSIDSLRGSGGEIAATAVGNKVFFAGYNQIDIYDLSTKTWSVSVLSEKRLYPTAVSTDNKVFFGGGSTALQGASNKIDIYDLPTDSWSISTLSEARYDMAGIAVAGKVYWAGGSLPSHGNNEQVFSCTVEIKDISSSSSSFASLFKPRDFFSYAGRGAVLKDDKIIFYINSSYLYLRESFNRFDIYDITNKTWTVGVLNQYIGAASIISVNNTIYIAGGNVNGTLNNQVWKLKF